MAFGASSIITIKDKEHEAELKSLWKTLCRKKLDSATTPVYETELSVFSAYTKSDVMLTCDKQLYGQPAGKDISQHFAIWPLDGFSFHGRDAFEMRRFAPGEPKKNIHDYFTLDSWLKYDYTLAPQDIPEERYDEVTLTITIPATVERLYDYVESLYKGEELKMINEDKIFTAKCTIKFKEAEE